MDYIKVYFKIPFCFTTEWKSVQRQHFKCYTCPGLELEKWWKHKQRWSLYCRWLWSDWLQLWAHSFSLVISVTTDSRKLSSCLSYKICRRNNLPLLSGGQCSQKVSLMILCMLEDLWIKHPEINELLTTYHGVRKPPNERLISIQTNAKYAGKIHSLYIAANQEDAFAIWKMQLLLIRSPNREPSLLAFFATIRSKWQKQEKWWSISKN